MAIKCLECNYKCGIPFTLSFHYKIEHKDKICDCSCGDESLSRICMIGTVSKIRGTTPKCSSSGFRSSSNSSSNSNSNSSSNSILILVPVLILFPILVLFHILVLFPILVLILILVLVLIPILVLVLILSSTPLMVLLYPISTSI